MRCSIRENQKSVHLWLDLVLLLVNCDDINEWPFCSYIIVRRTKSASIVYSGVLLILLFSTVIILNDWLRLDYIQQIACTISQRVPLKYFVRPLTQPQLISHRYPVHSESGPSGSTSDIKMYGRLDFQLPACGKHSKYHFHHMNESIYIPVKAQWQELSIEQEDL